MNLSFGRWPLGLDNRKAAERLNSAALCRADNLLIEPQGQVQSAKLPALSLPLAAASSLWTASNGQSYLLTGDTLCRIEGSALIPIGTLAGNDEAGFAEFGGTVFASRRGGVLQQLVGDTLRAAAINSPVFSASVKPYGGLPAGRYGVCVAALHHGQEQGTSALRLLNVAENGGIEITISGSGAVTRVFASEPNGSEPRFVADIASGLPYLIGKGKRGQLPVARFLEPLPAGRFLAACGGRLYSAAGLNIHYSEPMQPALCDTRHNHIRLESPASLLCAVEDGLYVADQHKSFFIENLDTGAQRLKPLSAPAPPSGGFACVSGALFGDLPDVPVAVWLGANGFVIGLPSGQCIERQSERLSIHTKGLAASLTCHQQRLWALTY